MPAPDSILSSKERYAEFIENVATAKVQVSGKYSWNLHRFLREKFAQGLMCRVFYTKRSMIDGQRREFDPDNVITPQIIIAYAVDDITVMGARLNAIMTASPRGKIKCWAFADAPADLVELTDTFWPEYERDGRCVIDHPHTMHFQGDKERFVQINRNSRRCQWCGAHMRRHVEKQSRIVRRDVWNVAGHATGAPA